VCEARLPTHPLLGLDSDLQQDRESPRNRRLSSGDEDRLLAAANPRLYGLIVAALETCARRGELLSLQWREVDLPRP
jgi:integrase